MNLKNLQILREAVIKKLGSYLKAEQALSMEPTFIEKSALDKLAKAKMEWTDAEIKWQKALLERADELYRKKKGANNIPKK